MKLSPHERMNLNWYEILALEAMHEIVEHRCILKRISIADWMIVKPLLTQMADSKVNEDKYFAECIYHGIKKYYPVSDN